MSKQGKLWNALTDPDTLSGTGIRAACSSESESEQEKLLDEMCEKFAATLTEAQATAFENVMGIASMSAWERHNRGIAEGLLLALELRTFLDKPSSAMRQGGSLLRSAYEVNKYEIKHLRAYFAAVNGGHDDERC